MVINKILFIYEELMHLGIMNKAVDEAESSEYEPYKMGAVIFKGSRILSSGHNEIRGNGKIHPKYKNFDNTLHAEQSAILDLKDWDNARGANILIIRLNKSGLFSLAYPCPMCQSFIRFLGMSKVFYTGRGGELEMVKVKNLLETDYENSWKLEKVCP